MTYITSANTYTIGKTYGIRVSINKALTGTLTINDGGVAVGIIAIGVAAQDKVYYGFSGSVTLVNSATEDITVSALNHQG